MDQEFQIELKKRDAKIRDLEAKLRGGSGGSGGGSPGTSPTCSRGGRLGWRSTSASRDGVEARFVRLMGPRTWRFFGVSTDYGIIVMRKAVTGIFAVDGGGEGPDVIGLPNAPGMVVWLSGQDGEIL